MGNEVSQTTPSAPGAQALDARLQKKFRRGIDLNLKILVRGERKTGKSQLIRSIQTSTFHNTYTPTPALTVQSFQLPEAATDEVVKVDFWDVVDEAIPQKKGEKAADASTCNVYQGAHALIVLYDPREPLSFITAKDIIYNRPDHVPAVLCRNFTDCDSGNAVKMEEAVAWCAEAGVPLLQLSLRNAFGLRELFHFINSIYLDHRCRSLELSLALAREKKQRAETEFSSSCKEQNYEAFLSRLAAKQKRSTLQDPAPPPQPNEQQQQQRVPSIAQTPSTSPSDVQHSVVRAAIPSANVAPHEPHPAPSAAPPQETDTQRTEAAESREEARTEKTEAALSTFSVGAIDDSFFSDSDEE